MTTIAPRIKSFENRTTPKPAGAAGGFFYAWILTAPIDIAGQRLGIKEVDDGIWLTSFMRYDLGYFDLEQKTLQPLDKAEQPARACISCGARHLGRRERIREIPTRVAKSSFPARRTDQP
jgi:hypothetical protein